MPRSLRVFCARKPLVSRCRRTVEVFRVARLAFRVIRAFAQQLAAIGLQMAHEVAAFHADSLRGSRMIPGPSRSTVVAMDDLPSERLL